MWIRKDISVACFQSVRSITETFSGCRCVCENFLKFVLSNNEISKGLVNILARKQVDRRMNFEAEFMKSLDYNLKDFRTDPLQF